MTINQVMHTCSYQKRPENHVESVNGRIVMEISAGVKPLEGKEFSNEVSSGVFTLTGNTELYAVANAPNGNHISEFTVELIWGMMESNLSRSEEKEIAQYRTMVDLDSAISRINGADSKTTLFTALKEKDDLCYAIVGDCQGYIINDEGLTSLANLMGMNRSGFKQKFIGEGKLRQAMPVREIGVDRKKKDYEALKPYVLVGKTIMPKKSTLLLATESLEESLTNVPIQELIKLNKGDLQKGIEQYFEQVMRSTNRGDNIGMIAVRNK